ncbi:hypothetical protein ACIBVL_36810 [Streptomyces sp. NPDC049687]|uniref:hypothetical protein n=1 Tax=Streptomyces sp. NPDC049687 TaxID=3365596 RepID=UPI0037BAE897
MARALALEPRLLILDEAVAVLDVSVQAQILNLRADPRPETGVAYLFISQDLGVVWQISDDCVVMHRGRVVEAGRTTAVLDDPQAPYTRRLLSAVQAGCHAAAPPRPAARRTDRPAVASPPSATTLTRILSDAHHRRTHRPRPAERGGWVMGSTQRWSRRMRERCAPPSAWGAHRDVTRTLLPAARGC